MLQYTRFLPINPMEVTPQSRLFPANWFTSADAPQPDWISASWDVWDGPVPA